MEPDKAGPVEKDRLIRSLNKKLAKKAVEVQSLRKRLSLDHERWRNVWAGVQSIALAGAVVVGGFWTVIHKNEVSLLTQPVLSINLKAEQLTFPTKGDRLVRVDLVVTETGLWSPVDSYLELGAADFTIRKITDIDRQGNTKVTSLPWRLQFGRNRANMAAGETETYEAIQSLPEPGIYRAEISVPAVWQFGVWSLKKEEKATLGTHIVFIVK